MKPKELILKIYNKDNVNFPKELTSRLEQIIKKYKVLNKTFTTQDSDYVQDLLLLRFLDTSFDKEMKEEFGLNLNLTSLEMLSFYSSKFNVLLLQMFKEPKKISFIIEQLHLYLTLLQEEDRFKEPKKTLDQILIELKEHT